MSFVELATLLGVIAGCLVSISLIWTKGVRPTIKALRRMSEIHDVIEQLPEWCASVDDTLKELRPNHGYSIKDTVNQTHAMLLDHIKDENLHSR